MDSTEQRRGRELARCEDGNIIEYNSPKNNMILLSLDTRPYKIE